METVSKQDNVIKLHHAEPFTLQEAKKLVPTIRRLTERNYLKAQRLMIKIENSTDTSKIKELEDKLHEIIDRWCDQIVHLGANPKWPWLVDFDSGFDYYWCWRYPEHDIEYYHNKKEGFSGRKPIH